MILCVIHNNQVPDHPEEKDHDVPLCWGTQNDMVYTMEIIDGRGGTDHAVPVD